MAPSGVDIQIGRLDAMICPRCRNQIPLTDRAPFSRAQCPHCKEPFSVPAKLGDYVLLRILAHGPLASTFEAQDRQHNRRVALQVIRTDGCDLELLRRFLLQARSLATVSHPNLLNVLELSKDKHQPRIAMGLIPGRRLAKLMKANKVWKERAALELAVALADGLRLAQQVRVIHGDISPDNILIAEDDRRPVLIDFGLDLLARTHRDDGKIWGAPLYIAPEKLRGHESTARTDMYSLGCLFYHLLTGRPPFHEQTVQETLAARLRSQPPSLAELRPELSPATVAVVDRMMQLDPQQRHADHASLHADLKQAIATLDAPAPPPPPSRSPVASRQTRNRARRKRNNRLATVLFLFMLAGLGVLVWLLIRSPVVRQGLPGFNRTSVASAASLEPFHDSFAGPALADGWKVLGGIGKFAPNGGYAVADIGEQERVGLDYHLAPGDFTIDVKLDDLKWAGNTETVGIEVIDDAMNSLLVHLHNEPNRVYFSFEYHDDHRLSTVHCQHNLATPPRAVSLRLIWREADKQWDIRFGVDGQDATTPLPIGPIQRYASHTKPARHIRIFTDQHGETGATAMTIRSFQLQPGVAAPTVELTADQTEPSESSDQQPAPSPE